MFLTLQEKPQSPIKKFMEFSCLDGHFFYKNENKTKVIKELPFEFIYLGEKRGIDGWDEPNGCGIFSNKVDNTTKEPLIVKNRKGHIIAEGLYSDIKDKVNAAGGVYATYAFILFEGELFQLELTGARLYRKDEKEACWSNYKPQRGVTTVVAKTKKAKKGKTEFVMPIFENGKPYDEQMMKKCLDLSKQISDYYDAVKEHEKTVEKINVWDVKKDENNQDVHYIKHTSDPSKIIVEGFKDDRLLAEAIDVFNNDKKKEPVNLPF